MKNKYLFVLLTLCISVGCKGRSSHSPLSSLWPLALQGTDKKAPINSSETPPSNLAFISSSTGTDSAVLTVGVSVSIVPTFSGTITNCTISPALPAGLTLNPATCAISGIPASSFPQTTFIITAGNQYGTATASLSLKGTADPPSNLSFPAGSSATFTTGTYSSLVPTFTGGITDCRVSPALPAGIILNPSNCAISGTPTAVSPQTNYTITAGNQFGTASVVLNFGINTLAPQNLKYSFGASVSVNSNTTVNYTPGVTGGITGCSISPALPAGLIFNTGNCGITGVPAVSSSGSYTVTAFNQYGNTDFTFALTTILTAPSAFSFPYSPGVTTVYTIGTPVTVSPAITGVVTNCTASPSLPAGLSLDPNNCSITGNPSAVSGAVTYTITASNSAGTVSTSIKLQVNNVPPSNLVYPFGASTVLAVGTAVSISPALNGGAASCTSSPALPAGLSLNAANCTLSGTPSAAKAAALYTITASNAYGSTNTAVTITAQLYAPSSLSFPFSGGTVNFTTGTAVNVSASVSGVVSSCTVNPALPSGLSLNASTCSITGTPNAVKASANYTITVSNASGNISTTVTIGVNPPPPSSLVYPSGGNLSFAVGTAKTVTPTLTGTVTNCVSNPSLPSGLTLNSVTCAISGTAAAEQGPSPYTVTASNSGGNTTANITISVAQPPLNLSYPAVSTLGYNNGVPISISPAVTGSSISYSISPSLPAGISLNASTGVISGTYSENNGSTASYTITAANSGGSITTNVTLTFFGKPPYKTGQTQCYDPSGNVISCSGTGQDGEYRQGVAGSVYSLPTQHPTYTDDYITTDATTGLVWKTCMEGLTGANCDAGTPVLTGQNMNSLDKCEILNSANGGNGYAGRNDWKYPTPVEMEKWAVQFSTLSSMSASFPNAFVTIGSAYFLAVSPNYTDILSPYCVNSSDSFKNSAGCPGSAHRCVSGTQRFQVPASADRGDTTVIDISTGILWQKCAVGASGSDCKTGTPTLLTWSDALNTCKNLNLLGRVWRLPNILEAMSFYQLISSDYKWDFTSFPFDQIWQEGTWSSTTVQADPSKAFISETISRSVKVKTSTHRVRCISSYINL